MVLLGGVTRLTHSGLSIVEWQPIVGALPPLSEQAWQETFHKYQQTPEYQKVNAGMSLEAFKGIFWWEYAHRLLGRAIGIAYLVPLLYFLWRRQINGGLARRLAVIFVVGGLQGAMGWYMVRSGLVDDPRVSPYRLTAHLGLALVLYAATLWAAMDLLARRRRSAVDANPRRLGLLSLALTALVFVMALSGGLVAGNRAGLVYNTFPLMNGRWIPPDIMALEPWYSNFFANMATVQFDHRLIAWLLALVVPWFWRRSTRALSSHSARLACHALLAALVLQLSLGIATLLHAVPVLLGTAHQAGALLLFTAALVVNHQLMNAGDSADLKTARRQAQVGPPGGWEPSSG
jgi:cytochrome c oxidase assembly protein subunit 15